MRALSFSATEKKVYPRNSGVDPGDLCGTKSYWKRLSSFWSFGTIPPTLYIHLNAAVIRRTNVPSLKSSNKASDFPQIRRIARQVILILRKFYRFLRRYITSKLITLRSVLFI
jgi:hypothetical protein